MGDEERSEFGIGNLGPKSGRDWIEVLRCIRIGSRIAVRP